MTEGNPEKKPIRSYMKDTPCPNCESMTVVYLGMEVTHGNIYTPASDTEVERYYTCDTCGKSWTKYA